jgi:hypothetical protein
MMPQCADRNFASCSRPTASAQRPNRAVQGATKIGEHEAGRQKQGYSPTKWAPQGTDTVITPTHRDGTGDSNNLSGTGASDLIDGQSGNDISAAPTATQAVGCQTGPSITFAIFTWHGRTNILLAFIRPAITRAILPRKSFHRRLAWAGGMAWLGEQRNEANGGTQRNESVGLCPIPRVARDRRSVASCALRAGQAQRDGE